MQDFITSSDVLLQAVRNPIDGGCDVQIGKWQVQKNNFKKPLPHSGLYRTRNKKNSYHVPLRKQASKQTIQSLYGKKVFKHLNILIYDNTFDKPVNEFKNIDKCNNKRPKPENQISQTLGIIVCKNKLNSDLANYHHASMFSLVRSTLLTAIGNNHFTTFPGLIK